MTKKFTKGCAVDVRGMSEVVFDAICKTIGTSFRKRDQEQMKYLSITERDDFKLSRAVDHSYDLLTPTDILGEHLVKAIEEGCTPYFKGDTIACEKADIVLANGFRASGNDMEYAIKTSSVIAYKPIEPSIQAKVLTEKVGPTSFLLLSEQSHNDLLNIKAASESIKKSDCEIAKAIMREVFKDLIDELDNKVGE